MTIREFLGKKARKAKIAALLFWLAFAGSLFIPGNDAAHLSLIPFFGFIGAIVYAVFFIKCPKCNARLSQVTLNTNDVFGGRSKTNFCSNCGVSLDQKM